MSGYIVLPIKRDPADAEETMLEVIRRQFPGWQAADGDPMTFALRSTAVLYSEAAELAVRMMEEAFRFYGRSVVALPPTDETEATGVALFTAQDDQGPYVVPEGLEITGRGELGEPVGFRTNSQAIVPNGATTVEVAVEATEAGEGSNGIGGAADFSEYVDYLVAVEFVGLTSGGEDREGDDDYLDRLREELALMSPRPIRAPDFAVLARRFGAYRATAIDRLDPADGSTDNEGMVTVAVMDEAGNPLTPSLRVSIEDSLEAMREVGFVVHVIDPETTAIDVGFTATAYPDWDPVAVHDAAIARLTSYLSPTRWGLRDDTGEDREWLNEPLVRWGEVYEQLQRVEGLRYVDSLGIAETGDPLGGVDVDVALAGFAPVPTPGVIAGTVAAG